MADNWVTTGEAAELSGYHVNHIRRLIRGKEIEATKKGNSWWVDKDSLVAYLKTAGTSGDKRWGPKS